MVMSEAISTELTFQSETVVVTFELTSTESCVMVEVTSSEVMFEVTRVVTFKMTSCVATFEVTSSKALVVMFELKIDMMAFGMTPVAVNMVVTTLEVSVATPKIG